MAGAGDPSGLVKSLNPGESSNRPSACEPGKGGPEVSPGTWASVMYRSRPKALALPIMNGLGVFIAITVFILAIYGFIFTASYSKSG